MKQAIVITTIFEPSEAVKAYANMPNMHLIVVGDKKTPSIGLAREQITFLLLSRSPWPPICRR